MTRRIGLKQINQQIEKSLQEYQKNEQWQTYDTALLNFCRPLDNRKLETVLPKVVAVDRLYQADLIRYLRRPADGESDYRPTIYVNLARSIAQIGLDNCFADLEQRGSRFSLQCIETIVEIHTTLAEAVRQVTERNGEVFASKYLHFCRHEYFPVIDRWAEQSAFRVLNLTDTRDEYLITERFGYDDPSRSRYDYFCRAVLAIQSTLASKGLGQYTLPEMDRYLYGYEEG